MVKSLFQDLIIQGVIIVYLDDILIHTKTWQEHLQTVGLVLQRIQEHNLQLQFRKCKWGCIKLKFLGFIISADGIQMDPTKISTITNFPTPKTLKSLQSFLGLANFSLRFIPNLAQVTKPLRQLLQKNVPFNWTAQFDQCFKQIKDMVQEVPILAHPDFAKPFKIQTDASNLGLGAVLLQQNNNNQWQPITFLSRSLTKSEQNYSTIEKELITVVWAFQKLHPYVHGTHVTVETDHQPLIALIQKKHPASRLLRWPLSLQEYTFDFTYYKGSNNVVADSLSRIEQQAALVDHSLTSFPLVPSQLAAAQQQDEDLVHIIHQLRSGNHTHLAGRYMIINNVLHFIERDQPPRIYIPYSYNHNILLSTMIISSPVT